MKIMGGGLTERYMLPAGLGIPLAAGYILPRFDRRLVALFGVLLCFGLAAHEVSFWLSQRDHLGKVISPAQDVEELVKRPVTEIFLSSSLTLWVTSNSRIMIPDSGASVEVTTPRVLPSWTQRNQQFDTAFLHPPSGVRNPRFRRQRIRSSSCIRQEVRGTRGPPAWWMTDTCSGWLLFTETGRVYLVRPKDEASQGMNANIVSAGDDGGRGATLIAKKASP